MVTDAQVRLLRRKMKEDKQIQETAAAAAGMSVRSARSWQEGPLPSETKSPRSWRTRVDPFAGVWASELLPLLEADAAGVLEAQTLIEVLGERHPGEFIAGQVRTLQRRVRDWRALHGPHQEVYFPQVHRPGHQASVDFTHATELGVTIRGAAFVHLLFQFVACFSGWTWVTVAFGETFEALVAGLQGALWALGGVVEEVRSDNLSAATHELKHSGGRSLTQRFRAVLDHYGLRSSRIRPGESHENGVVEKAHDLTKRALVQALVLRGSSDFDSADDYLVFVREVVDKKRNRAAGEKLELERKHLRALPPAPIPSYTTYSSMVRRWSTIRVSNRAYSVPSRLIGHMVDVRQHADIVEVFYKGKLIETMSRLRGEAEARIDYRHVIWSLVRKPAAFASYKYREELFPTLTFRRAYDALREIRGDRADVEYLRILHLAASTMEARVEQVLTELLRQGHSVDYASVRAIASPEQSTVPQVVIPQPDLRIYDGLLLQGGAR
jgi:hypothetical protein